MREREREKLNMQKKDIYMSVCACIRSATTQIPVQAGSRNLSKFMASVLILRPTCCALHDLKNYCMYGNSVAKYSEIFQSP
jgi:hypothetical protein